MLATHPADPRPVTARDTFNSSDPPALVSRPRYHMHSQPQSNSWPLTSHKDDSGDTKAPDPARIYFPQQYLTHPTVTLTSHPLTTSPPPPPSPSPPPSTPSPHPQAHTTPRRPSSRPQTRPAPCPPTPSTQTPCPRHRSCQAVTRPPGCLSPSLLAAPSL
jgi:hypothetical protein